MVWRSLPVKTGLESPGLREGKLLGVNDDQVIEDAHVDELQSLAQAQRGVSEPYAGLREVEEISLSRP